MKKCPQCAREHPDDLDFCPIDGTPLLGADPYVGSVVDELFTIEAPIGEGGMGTVYRARQHDIDRPVAIKILRPELLGLGEAAERFHREARLAGRIQSPHVAHIYRTGQLPNGNVYLALEYLDGHSLEHLVRTVGALPAARAVHIIRQAGEAVAEAHDLGIVHRDLKPENVMLVRVGTDEDYVKLLDFGVAKQLDGGEVSLTGAGLAIGTPLYISPEAASGGEIGTAADVYSLGVILYEALCGLPPFDGDVPAKVFLQHVRDEPPRLLDRRGAQDVPPALASFVHRCLAKDPKHRPRAGRDFVDELERAWSSEPVEPEERATVAPPSRPAPIARRARRSRARWPWMLLAIACAAGAGLGAWRLLDDARVRDLQRRSERAWAEGELEGPEGAITLSELVVVARPKHRGAARLRRRMAQRLQAQARSAESAGETADALETLELVERLRPDDARLREWRERLEAIAPATEPTPDSPHKTAASSRQIVMACAPPAPVAGRPAQLSVSLRGFRGVRLTEPRFQVRALWKGMRFRGATVAAEAKGRTSYAAGFTFPTRGRYLVSFSSKTRDRPITKSLQVMVSAGVPEPAAPEPAAPEPVAPEPAAPEPVAPGPPAEGTPAETAPGPVEPAPGLSPAGGPPAATPESPPGSRVP